MAVAKKRSLLDTLAGRFDGLSRDEIYARIMCGEVIVEAAVVRDPKHLVRQDCEITFRRRTFVSRGGEKLDVALEKHRIDVSGMVVLDAGASTGGFTECLLKRGASRVHAVDVGYNQLAYNLRTDTRVCVHERCNIMAIESLDPQPDCAVADLSFRSLRGAAVHLLNLVRRDTLLALVKPQFEWKCPPTEFDGVVRSAEDTVTILHELIDDLADEGSRVIHVTESCITGRRGNKEYFFEVKSSRDLALNSIKSDIREVVFRNRRD